VLPCYNTAQWVGRAIGSVLAQDYPGLIVIAVDDGSTDGTLAALRVFGDAITVETGPNCGACHARNRGLALAAERGAEYVVFLDADDHFEGPILRHAAAVAVQTGADLVVSGMFMVNPQGIRTDRRHYSGRIAPEAIFSGWLRHVSVVPGALLWRRSFVEELGWDESLSRYQDTDLVLRAMLRHPLVMKNETGVLMYLHENPHSISRSRSRAHIESQIRVLQNRLADVPGTSFAPAIPLLCIELYKAARLAFLHGQPDLGHQAVRAIAAGSMHGAPWAWNWPMLLRLIGLRPRVQLRAVQTALQAKTTKV
jgi:hypothetical protein